MSSFLYNMRFCSLAAPTEDCVHDDGLWVAEAGVILEQLLAMVALLALLC